MKRIFIFLLIIISLGSFAQEISESPKKEIYLPAELIEGRFFIKIPSIAGATVAGFCDTGGGYTAIYSSTVKKLGLQSKVKVLVIDGDTIKYIPAKEIFRNKEIPYPQIPDYFKAHINIPFFQVPDDTKENIFLQICWL
jgi:hypothetical protein